jgi:uncharacterized protein with ParB-like and HNH nuclease domain/predicted transport protein
MIASEAKLLDFLKKSPQFIIPIYQRTYSWEEGQCEQLWSDILRAGKDNAIGGHFIGSVVYIQQDLYQVSNQSPLLVIDGQQRLTTGILIIEALCRHLGDSEPIEGFSAKKLRHYYLLNSLEEGERGFKLLLTQTDKDSLLSLLKQKPWPANPSLRVKANFEYFDRKIAELHDFTPLCIGLAKLMIVDIALTRGQDNPQLIFESMNSTGRALTQADLIRNFILMGLEQTHQTRLYADHWRPMELEFGQDGYKDHFDWFMRHYLTVRTGQIPKIGDVYDAFKAFARRPEQIAAGVDQLVKDIQTFGSYYCAMAFGKEKDSKLAEAFNDLLELRVDVAYPFLLELYDDYTNGILSKDDFVSLVKLIESYVFRRWVCSIPTNSLNKTFATFGRTLNKDRYLEGVLFQFLTLPSYRRFPDDEEFRKELMRRDLYNTRMRSYWLRRLENHGRKERVAVLEYTIEHILPQNENLSIKWREALGPDWKRIQKDLLHTLGNLTLTGYNSEYSDRPFPEKRDMLGGFKQSPLRLNEGLGAESDWNEHTILARAERLAEKAIDVWKLPTLPESVLASLKQPNIPATNYDLSAHQYLALGTVARTLFDAIRKEVLALDPGVKEEVLKLYIAFKAETNFVDMVPQKNRLQLSLNMPFHELSDPKGIAKDVSGLGRWGNGDVEVGLNELEEIPYIMGLIRQSFERQMGVVEGEN